MVTILMATYNGEKYLEEQLNSLFSQTYKDFSLIISDDASTDNTIKILHDYQKKYPQNIQIIEKNINSGNAKYNFLDMMVNFRDDYLMLCDQDDIWLPEKIEKSIKKIQTLEQSYGKHAPLLVHTDLIVVDETLKVINPSFKMAMDANYDRTELNQILIQNTLTGCTVIYNKVLANLLKQRPKNCIMHDWWLMLIAAAFGKIDHIDEGTILYRQHGKNEIGAKDVRTIHYKINKLFHSKEIKKAISDTYVQAKSFLDIYDKQLKEDQRQNLEIYCQIPNMNKFDRWKTICQLGALKNGLSRKIANFLFI